jgi:hypothetical protein
MPCHGLMPGSPGSVSFHTTRRGATPSCGIRRCRLTWVARSGRVDALLSPTSARVNGGPDAGTGVETVACRPAEGNRAIIGGPPRPKMITRLHRSGAGLPLVLSDIAPRGPPQAWVPLVGRPGRPTGARRSPRGGPAPGRTDREGIPRALPTEPRRSGEVQTPVSVSSGSIRRTDGCRLATRYHPSG